MAFGQLAKKRKLGASVLAYVIISIVTSTVFSLSGMQFFVAATSNMGPIFHGAQGLWKILLLGILYNLVLTAIYYFPTRHIFKNKLSHWRSADIAVADKHDFSHDFSFL